MKLWINNGYSNLILADFQKSSLTFAYLQLWIDVALDKVELNSCTDKQTYKIYTSVVHHQLFVKYFYCSSILKLYSAYRTSCFFFSSEFPKVLQPSGGHLAWRFLRGDFSIQCIGCWTFYSPINFEETPTSIGSEILRLNWMIKIYYFTLLLNKLHKS